MRAAATLLACFFVTSAAAQDYKFDISEFEKKPYEFGGFIEGRAEHFSLDRDAVFYGLNQPGGTGGATNDRMTGTAELFGRYTKDIATLGFRAQLSQQADADDKDRSDFTLLEGGLTLQPEKGRSLDIGKKALKWGKGYAWNPVGFVERSKDPTDPDLSREGFWMLTGDSIWSFDGPLRTVGVTPVVMPVSSAVNSDYGRDSAVNVAGKLYLLLYETDIDLIVLGEGTRSARYGLDFSRNLTSNLVIHGEFAYVSDAERRVLGPGDSVRTVGGDAINWLIGARYLSATDTTYILEYYRNGAGFTEGEEDDFFRFARDAVAEYRDTGATGALDRANSLSQGGFARPNPFRDYLYFRVSQKEPFDILYLTPALTTIVNLDDRSLNLVPEIVYTGFTNWEMRLRASVNLGGTDNEYGEKQADARIELRLRWYF